MSAYETVDFCIEAGMLPRSMLVEMRNRLMGLLQSLNNNTPSVSDSSKDICRQKIKFYMHLSEGDLVRARAAMEALRLLYNDALDTLMFGDKSADVVVLAGATSNIQYQSDKTDQNAKTMGDRFMGELKRWEQMLTCRVV